MYSARVATRAPEGWRTGHCLWARHPLREDYDVGAAILRPRLGSGLTPAARGVTRAETRSGTLRFELHVDQRAACRGRQERLEHGCRPSCPLVGELLVVGIRRGFEIGMTDDLATQLAAPLSGIEILLRKRL